MYRIYADNELLYSPEIPDPQYKLIDAVLTTELNRAGSLELTLPPIHKDANKLQFLKTDISVKYTADGSTEKTRFFGRILNSERDMDGLGSHKFTCEGDLAFLNDTVQRPYSFIQSLKWAFSRFIARHNSELKGGSHRAFNVGICDMSTDEVAEDATSYGAYIYTEGTKINHTTTAGEAVLDSDIDFATAGMLYLNRKTYRLYKCTVGGDKTNAIWAYVGNIKAVTGTVAEGNLYHVGDEIYGTATEPTEMNASSVDDLEIGDIYINNTTYGIYLCVQRPYTEEELEEYDVGYNENPAELWVYLGNIASMVAAADKRIATGAMVFSSEDYSNSWELFSDVLLDTYGGYLYTSESSNGARYLNWTKKSGEKGKQVIQFGNNLLDFSEHVSAESIVTRLIPIGAEVYDEEGNDLGYKIGISSVNSGLDYIENQLGMETFGSITRMVEFEDGVTPNVLLDLAKTYLQESIKMAITLDLTAFDLSLIDVDADDIQVGNSYRVIYEPFGIDDYFVCSKAEIDILHPENSKFTFGVDTASLTGLTTKSNFVTAADAPVYIKSSETYWLVNEDPETKPDVHDDAWSTDTPTWSSTTYVWQKTVDTYSDGTIKESDPICLTGHHGESTISVTITSSAGDMFLRRDINTILTCNVYYGTKDYSDHVTSYHWVKKDKDGNVDDTWSRMPGKSISITSDDVNTKAIFDCEVTLVI